MLNAVLLSKPEMASPDAKSRGTLKQAMIAEATFAATHLKAFLGCVFLVGVVAADATVADSPGEHYTLVGVLTLTVAFLVRHVLKKDEEIKRLYERLSKREREEDREAHRARP